MDRVLIKSKAREALSPRKGNAAIVTLLYTLIAGITAVTFRTKGPIPPLYYYLVVGVELIGIFVIPVIEVGYLRYCLNIAEEKEVGVKTLFSGFATNYWQIVKVTFVSQLPILIAAFMYIVIFSCYAIFGTSSGLIGLVGAIFICFFSIAFIVFTFVYTYGIFMVPYLLADEEEYTKLKTSGEFIKMSFAMSNGHKFEIFVFQLSFILWIILGVLTFGIANLYVEPYMCIANAYLYKGLKSK